MSQARVPMVGKSAARLSLGTEWPELDESGLIRAAREDVEAFGELCDRYSGRLYSYLRARTQCDEDAADLLQQTFVQALRAFPNYHDRGAPFGAWLFRIARNLAVDAHRRKCGNASWELLPEALRASNGDDLDNRLLREETRAHVRSLLGGLPAEDRDLILLRFVAGLTLRQIAAVIGKRESTVHKKIVRTLRTLKERYDANE